MDLKERAKKTEDRYSGYIFGAEKQGNSVSGKDLRVVYGCVCAFAY